MRNSATLPSDVVRLTTNGAVPEAVVVVVPSCLNSTPTVATFDEVLPTMTVPPGAMRMASAREAPLLVLNRISLPKSPKVIVEPSLEPSAESKAPSLAMSVA